MSRAKRDSTLETRTSRLKLEPRDPPYWSTLAEGQHVGYYRPASKAAGTWRMKWRDKATGARKASVIGPADDYEDADGSRILNWAQAQERARAWFKAQADEARRRADGEEIHEGPYTVAMAMEDYRLDCERRGVKGIDRQRYQIDAHILPTLGTLEVAALTKKRLERWLDALAKSPRRLRQPKHQKEGATPKVAPPPKTEDEKRARKDSANRVLTILKAALNYAHLNGPAAAVEPVWEMVLPYRGTTSARVRFLAIEEQVRLVNACEPDFRKLVQAALLTGARCGELTKLTVAEFSREAQTLFIPAVIAKSGKARHIYLTDEGMGFFEEMTAGRDGAAILFERTQHLTAKGKLVGRRSRTAAPEAWAKGDHTRDMHAACDAAKIERLTFHELRHTAASTWIAAGMDLIIVARQLGHSDTRMVEKHYGHLCPNAAAARFRALAPTLGIVGKPKVKTLSLQSQG